MDKEEVGHIHNGVLFSPKKEPPKSQWQPKRWNSNSHTEGNKSESKRHLPWLTPPICRLTMGTRVAFSTKEMQGLATRCWLPDWRGRVWEGLGLVGQEMQTLARVWEVGNNEVLLSYLREQDLVPSWATTWRRLFDKEYCYSCTTG